MTAWKKEDEPAATEWTPDSTQGLLTAAAAAGRAREPSTWNDVQSLVSNDYICGRCGSTCPPTGVTARRITSGGCTSVTAATGRRSSSAPKFRCLARCLETLSTTCHRPSAIADLWDETRRAMTVGSWTLVVVACRKMLMNVAVDQGAKSGAKYSHYVDWMAKNKLAPGNDDWVERVRHVGGEVNHAIHAVERDDAMDLVDFLAHLLRTVYEFPAKMRKRAEP